MSWNGAGVYSRIHNWTDDESGAINMEAARFDAEHDSIATGLNNCLTKNGENAATANINLGSNKLINVTPGTAATDAATIGGIETFTNKTLTSPAINTPTGIVKGDVGLGNVDNTSDATKDAATATLTNKTINLSSNTLSMTIAQANTALSDGDFATLVGTETITNKDLSSSTNTFPINLTTTIPKTGSTSRSSTTTLADDPHLTTSVIAISYKVKLFLIFECADTVTDQDVKIKLKIPAATTPSSFTATRYGYDATFNGYGSDDNAEFTIPVAFSSGGGGTYIGTAIIIDGSMSLATTGTFALQWAQSVSSANAITLQGSKSYMEITEL